MKKKLITLALTSITTATYAASTTPAVNGGDGTNEVYTTEGTSISLGGRAEFRGDFIGTDTGEKIDGTMDDRSRVRINIGGVSQISDSLSAFGFYEAEQATDGSDLNQRYAYVGLAGRYGAFTFGKQNTANVQLSDMSDIGTYTGDQKAFIDAGDEQQTNNISYIGEFDSLRVQASYIAGEEEDTDGYGLSAIYSLPFGLDLGLGYTGADQDQSQITAGASYMNGGFYTGLTYTTGDTANAYSGNTDNFDGVELSAQYLFDNQFRIIGAYQNQQTDGDDTANFLELTGGYDLNKHVYAYLSYKFNQLDDNNSIISHQDTEDSMRLGLKYTF
ncbi:TPA: porin [Vibrio parahaemolyticus]|nr:porin [Vibrio parahaemolyticus]